MILRRKCSGLKPAAEATDVDVLHRQSQPPHGRAPGWSGVSSGDRDLGFSMQGVGVVGERSARVEAVPQGAVERAEVLMPA